MSKKNNIFAQNNDEYYEPTALATDSGRGIPVLTGEAAERFVRMAEENERKARERAKKTMTLQEAKDQIAYNKMFMESALSSVKYYEEKIKKLEEYIKTINGEKQECF